MSRDGGERGQLFSAPFTETAETDGNHPLHHQQQRWGTPPITMQHGAHPGGDQTALLNMLRAQVEYYFSPQNLSRDNYLRNMLADASTKQQHQPPPPQNMQLMTPIEVIANFPKVWNICASFGAAGMMPEPPAVLLGKALQGSNIVIISADGAWIGPRSQQLPIFTGSAPPSPSPSHGPPATIATSAPHFPHNPPYNMSPYPPPQMMMIPMQQPDGTMLHQNFPPPYYLGPPPPPHDSNRPLSAGSGSPSSASLEDAGSIPSQMKESSKRSVASASGASLSSLSEQPSQVQLMQTQQQQHIHQPQYGGPMMGQQPPGGYPMSPHQQQFLPPPYGASMPPYPPYYNPAQQMYQPNFMPPPGVRYGSPGGGLPPPPPRGYHGGVPPPPYPYQGMMQPPPPPPPQFVGDGYPPPHPHGYPPRYQPNVGDNRKGGGSFDVQKKVQDGYKKKKKNNNNFDRKRGNDQHHHNYGYRSPNFGQQQTYGGTGSAPPSPHFNNRYQNQHEKMGGESDKQTNNEAGKGAVFNPLDFPGLDGKAASDTTQRKTVTAPDEKLVGYASALLKRNEKGNASSTGKTAPSAVKSPENVDDNTMTQQMEAMEKEILSEFHDLSIRENEHAEHYDINNKKYDANVTSDAEDKTDGHTEETSPTSTDNDVASPQSTGNGNSLTILPEPNTKTPEANPPKQISRVDLEEGEGSAPLPVVEQLKPAHDNKNDDDEEPNIEVEKPKPPAAWGSKRLFADVVASQKK